jgi:hypothetical protein
MEFCADEVMSDFAGLFQVEIRNCSGLFFDCNFGEVVWKFDRRIGS